MASIMTQVLYEEYIRSREAEMLEIQLEGLGVLREWLQKCRDNSLTIASKRLRQVVWWIVSKRLKLRQLSLFISAQNENFMDRIHRTYEGSEHIRQQVGEKVEG